MKKHNASYFIHYQNTKQNTILFTAVQNYLFLAYFC